MLRLRLLLAMLRLRRAQRRMEALRTRSYHLEDTIRRLKLRIAIREMP